MPAAAGGSSSSGSGAGGSSGGGSGGVDPLLSPSKLSPLERTQVGTSLDAPHPRRYAANSGGGCSSGSGSGDSGGGSSGGGVVLGSSSNWWSVLPAAALVATRHVSLDLADPAFSPDQLSRRHAAWGARAWSTSEWRQWDDSSARHPTGGGPSGLGGSLGGGLDGSLGGGLGGPGGSSAQGVQPSRPLESQRRARSSSVDLIGARRFLSPARRGGSSRFPAGGAPASALSDGSASDRGGGGGGGRGGGGGEGEERGGRRGGSGKPRRRPPATPLGRLRLAEREAERREANYQRQRSQSASVLSS
jgi:hypothetical protein